MRKSTASATRCTLVVLAATALALLSERSALASPQPPDLIEDQSTLFLRIAASPDIGIAVSHVDPSFWWILKGSVLGPSTGHAWIGWPSAWSTINFGPGTSLFTGVPLISNLLVTAKNEAGIIQSGIPFPSGLLGPGGPGTSFGGFFRLQGQVVIHAMDGQLHVPVPLDPIGGYSGSQASTTMVTLSGHDITVSAGPFATGPVAISQITTNLITLPARSNVPGVGFTLQPTSLETVMTPSTNGGYVSISGGRALEVHTVTISGANSIDPGSAFTGGAFTVISPLRIDTSSIAGRIPGAVTMRVTYTAPEPGTLLMLVCGCVALAVMGRRRMRR